MADPNFAPLGEESSDDLPRTFRREKEAREREAREKAARERAAAPTLSTTPDAFAAGHAGGHSGGPAASAPSAAGPRIYAEPSLTASKAMLAGPQGLGSQGLQPAIVRDIDVPFPRLVRFFVKAVLASVPALILLMVLLWGFGQFLSVFFPNLVKMKILIGLGG